MMEDKIYTTDELIDMDVYTSDFEFMDKACEVIGTLIIKGCMGLVAAWTVHKGRLLGGVAAEAIMVGGYFLYESTLLGYGMAAAASIPGNGIQGTVGLVLGLLLYGICKKQNLIK